jgi:hypothetical protein
MTPNPHRGSDFAEFLAEEGLMTPTPRTDAAIAASGGQWSFTLRDLAQEMERELASKDAQAGEIYKVYKAALDLAAKLEEDLAGERALADRLAIALVQSMERLGVCAGHRKILDQWKEARSDP